jgi:FkbM family methyltransferase
MTRKQIAERILRRFGLRLLPRKRHLNFLFWLHRTLDEPEQELLALEKIIPHRRNVAIDVGVNVGYYSLALSRYFKKVFSFEANPGVVNYLEEAKIANVSIHKVGLSSEKRKVVLYVPLHGGKLPIHGWGSLYKENCPGFEEFQEIEVEIVPLDTCPIENPDFIKIDVEGHEVDVLIGASQTIARCQPTILVEMKAGNRDDVRKFFHGMAYKEENLSALIPGFTPSENAVFTPARRK